MNHPYTQHLTPRTHPPEALSIHLPIGDEGDGHLVGQGAQFVCVGHDARGLGPAGQVLDNEPVVLGVAGVAGLQAQVEVREADVDDLREG
jgi:hypothetical protein